MNLDTFIELLDRHGPDLDRWPAAERTNARRLLQTSAQAAEAIGHARTLDALLGELPDRPASPHLAGRIAAQTGTRGELWTTITSWFAQAVWRPALAASVPLIFGFVLGFTYARPTDTSDADLLEAVGLLPFSASFEELSYED